MAIVLVLQLGRVDLDLRYSAILLGQEVDILIPSQLNLAVRPQNQPVGLSPSDQTPRLHRADE